jgi:hypothetical protein
MPRAISELDEIQIGDYAEDCNFQPGIVTEKYDVENDPNYGMVRIQSYVHDGMDGYCSVWHCGLRILTEDEVMQWLISGPSDVDTESIGINWWRRKSVFEIEPPKTPPRAPRTPPRKKQFQKRRIDGRRR